MLFIGICGASGSGKSTLAQELATMVNKSILIINQDAYYFDHPDLTFEEKCHLNYDEPSIFDHDLLLSEDCCIRYYQPYIALKIEFYFLYLL